MKKKTNLNSRKRHKQLQRLFT